MEAIQSIESLLTDLQMEMVKSEEFFFDLGGNNYSRVTIWDQTKAYVFEFLAFID